MTDTKPTAAARRVAISINEFCAITLWPEIDWPKHGHPHPPKTIEQLVFLIDRETGLPELIAALGELRPIIARLIKRGDGAFSDTQLARIDAALARARGQA